MTSESPWITVDSNGIVTASLSAIQHDGGSLSAVTTHNDTVKVSYSTGEGESKVTKDFTVSFEVIDNDAVAVNSELKALQDAAAGGDKDGLLSLLKYVAEKYYPLGELSVRDEVLIKRQGATKEALMDLLCNASSLSGVASGGYDTDGLKVNYGKYVGTLVYGKPEECKVESRSDILDETQRQNRIEEERTRLHDAAASGTPHEQLEAALKYMAKNGYDVDTNTDMDTLLLEKKGSVETIKKLLVEELALSGVTACTSESSGLVVRLTEGADTYVGTMVSNDEANTKVVKETVSPDTVELYVVSSGKPATLPDGAKTEYQVDITGLNGVTFEQQDDSWVDVSASGKITPKDHSLQFTQGSIKAVEKHDEIVTVKYGDKSSQIKVTVIDEYAKEYNAEVGNIVGAISGDSNHQKLEKVLKYIEVNYGNDPTIAGRDEVVMGKKGSGQAIQDLLVAALKECGVPVKPGAVDDHILRIYVTDGNDNYEGSLTFTDPRTSKVEQKDFAVNGEDIRDIIAVGLPSTIMASIGSVMNIGMNAILQGFREGNAALNVMAIYFKLQSLIFMPVFGMANGIIAIIGYNYGARIKKRIYQCIRVALVWAGTIMVIGTLLFMIFPDALMAIFEKRDITDAETRLVADQMNQIGPVAMRIIATNFIFAAVGITLSTVFQAIGKGTYSMILSICRQLVILLPAAWLLAQLTGSVYAVWWCFPIAEIVSLVICLYMYRTCDRKMIAPLPD